MKRFVVLKDGRGRIRCIGTFVIPVLNANTALNYLGLNKEIMKKRSILKISICFSEKNGVSRRTFLTFLFVKNLVSPTSKNLFIERVGVTKVLGMSFRKTSQHRPETSASQIGRVVEITLYILPGHLI